MDIRFIEKIIKQAKDFLADTFLNPEPVFPEPMPMNQPVTEQKETLSFVFIGMIASGRSTFLNTICENARIFGCEYFTHKEFLKAIEHQPGTYVTMDFGWIDVSEDIRVFFHANHFTELVLVDLLLEMCDGSQGSCSFVVMVDSSTPETFNSTVKIIHKLECAEIPYVVVANKQDLPNAWLVDDVRIALRVPDDIPVLPCVAHDKKSVASVLIALCEVILNDIEADEAEIAQ
jgi:uncharacterized protein